jgi:hypothetical protein
MKLTQKFLAMAAATESLERTEIHATTSGFTVMAKIRKQEAEKLYTDRGEVRAFKSWNTCMRYLRLIGVIRVTVDMTEWEPEALSVKEQKE